VRGVVVGVVLLEEAALPEGVLLFEEEALPAGVVLLEEAAPRAGVLLLEEAAPRAGVLLFEEEALPEGVLLRSFGDTAANCLFLLDCVPASTSDFLGSVLFSREGAPGIFKGGKCAGVFARCLVLSVPAGAFAAALSVVDFRGLFALEPGVTPPPSRDRDLSVDVVLPATLLSREDGVDEFLDNSRTPVRCTWPS
jgi:hypothetical protein